MVEDDSNWKKFIKENFWDGGVYSIYNQNSKRFYIGESENIGFRMFNHMKEILTTNTRPHKVSMREDFLKYGIGSFRLKVLCCETDIKKRLERETFYSRQLASILGADRCYSTFNLSGQSKPPKAVLTEEQLNAIWDLKQQGNTYKEIAQICNTAWDLDYSFGRYCQFVKKAQTGCSK